MQILYTGAIKQGAAQFKANLSLGGYPSNTLVANDMLSNLFPTASIYAIQSKLRNTKMLALYNDENDILTDISIRFEVPNDSICKYKIALVRPTITTEGDSCFEQINSPLALPYHATFSDIVNNSVFNIPLLQQREYLGMWLMREYDYNSQGLKQKKCTDWADQYAANPEDPNNTATLNTVEQLKLFIDYTLGEPSVSNSISVI